MLKRFKEQGFINVKLVPIYDLRFALLNKDEEIERVIINNIEEFSEYENFKVDSEIMIEYHTFNSNEP